MLMGAHDGAVDEVQAPVQEARAVALLLQAVQNALPDPRLAPAVEPARHRRPRAEAGRQIAPGGSGAQDPQQAAEHRAMIVVGASRPWFLGREQGTQLLPLSIAEFFTCHTLSLKAVCRHALVRAGH